MRTVRLTRRYRFEAAHRLVVSGYTPEQNWEIYGKCSREGGHGHNYEIDVTVAGVPDPVTGLVIERERMDRIVEERVVDRCDHRDLNDVIPDVVTTGENLAVVYHQWLEDAFTGPARLVRVRVHETARNVFDAVSLPPSR
ncbi:MAG TPA: 6-carboxytetrahydropterin synthase [Candidatus Krumholzibacteria bacterium]|nr:6-carboxytetrahydropterin synthase [Candidatus Krumholzibacteria bacterium]